MNMSHGGLIMANRVDFTATLGNGRTPTQMHSKRHIECVQKLLHSCNDERI